MTAGSWIVRWDTDGEPKPRVLSYPAGGPAPAVADTPSGGFVVFDGYLFDRDELGPAPVASDVALVAAAYDRWQDKVFDKLRGSFTVAVWDDALRRVRVVRDAMGLNPCFYCWDGRVFLASPSLDAVLGQPEVHGRFNRIVLAEYVRNSLSRRQVGETFYEEVRRLPPAHAVSVGRRTLTSSRYWDPVPPGFSWAGDDEVSQFTGVLERAVGRCLSVGADSLGLSGGFDSVSIAVAAAEQRGQRSLHALSLRFAGASCDEGQTQTEVARALGMPHLMRSLDDCLEDDAFRGGLLTLSAASPNPVLSPWQPMYARLLTFASELGLSRMMMGSGGDEMFYVNSGYAADCLVALDAPDLWRLIRAYQRTSRSSSAIVARDILWEGAIKAELKRLARRALGRVSPRGTEWILERRQRRRRPSWLVPDDPRLLDEVERRRRESSHVETAPGEGAYVRTMRGLTQAPLLSMELDQGHAWAKQSRFTLLFPYFDRDLVDLSLRLHPSRLIAGGQAKAPLRRLVAERLPTVRMRPEKVRFTHVFDGLFRPHGHRAWKELGGPIKLAELGLVDPRGVDDLMEAYFSGAEADGFTPWLLYSTELWLRARSSASQTYPAQEAPA